MLRRVIVVACVACVARTVLAQPEPTPSPSPPDQQTQAEALYREGSKHYDLREYADAIDAFKRAYALVPEPTFLFDIAQAYRQLHDCDNALAFYRNYLRAKPDADDRAQVDKLAAESQTCADEQARERQADRERLLATAAAAKPAPAARRYRALRLAGIVTAGVGVIAAGVGVYFSIDAADKAHALEQACTPRCNAIDVASIDTQGKASQDRAVVLYISGGAAVAAGVGMIAYSLLRASPEAVTVAPVPGGATVRAGFHF